MKTLEQRIRAFLEARHWDQLRPGDLAKSIAIEAGELLEVFQWDNPELAAVKDDPARLEKIKGELADVLIYCMQASVLLGLDTEAIMLAKLEKAEKKYPAELFSEKRDEPGTEDVYWKIKNEHRKNTGV